jgi:hypothetical protein
MMLVRKATFEKTTLEVIKNVANQKRYGAIMKGIFVGLVLILLSIPAWSYTAFTLDKERYDTEQPTDVFLVGQGKELGLQFLYSAITRAKRYKELYPNRRALIIWSREKGKNSDKKVITNRGFGIVINNNKYLYPETAYRLLKKLHRIHSIHIYSHSSAWYGAGLQKGKGRVTYKDEDWSDIQWGMTDDAYVVLHGCNTGFYEAPRLSAKIDRPVFGSMTSTDFQQIHTDGHWYHNNKGQYPWIGGWAKTNDLNYSSEEACWKGYCHRMKTNNHPYTGGWGRYKTGLPFYKVFCNFTQDYEGRTRCLNAMNEQMMTWPGETRFFASFSEEQILDNIRDYLCPRQAKHSIHDACRSVLARQSIQPKGSFWGKNTPCSVKKCDFWTFNGGYKAKGFDSKDAGTRTIVEEYIRYLDAFNL